MNKIEKKIQDGRCYNFALTLVNEWQLKARGRVDLDVSRRLALELGDELRAVIAEFKRGVAERGLAPK